MLAHGMTGNGTSSLRGSGRRVLPRRAKRFAVGALRRPQPRRVGSARDRCSDAGTHCGEQGIAAISETDEVPDARCDRHAEPCQQALARSPVQRHLQSRPRVFARAAQGRSLHIPPNRPRLPQESQVCEARLLSVTHTDRLGWAARRRSRCPRLFRHTFIIDHRQPPCNAGRRAVGKCGRGSPQPTGNARRRPADPRWRQWATSFGQPQKIPLRSLSTASRSSTM